MTRNLLLTLCLLFGLHAAPAHAFARVWGPVTQTTTPAAPTLGTQGMDLNGLHAYRVTVCLVTGTLAGGEKLIPYVLTNAQTVAAGAPVWAPVPANVLTVAANGTTLEGCFTWTDVPFLTVPYGRVYYAASGFAASVKVSIDAWGP